MTTCAPEDEHLPGSPFYDSVFPIPHTCECVRVCACVCIRGNFHRGQRLKSGNFLCPFCESGSLTKPGSHQEVWLFPAFLALGLQMQATV